LDFILPYLQIQWVIRDGFVTIRTTVRKLLNQSLPNFLFHRRSFPKIAIREQKLIGVGLTRQ
jgi:hypothetical protein